MILSFVRLVNEVGLYILEYNMINSFAIFILIHPPYLIINSLCLSCIKKNYSQPFVVYHLNEVKVGGEHW